jgi:hypothetical protein
MEILSRALNNNGVKGRQESRKWCFPGLAISLPLSFPSLSLSF